MAHYVIGDVQGCYRQLQQLLEQVQFDTQRDSVWFCGDLVARGPESLATLRFVKSLGSRAVTVLGNHDLNLLASRYGYGRIQAADQLDELRQASDFDELADWLQQQPLLFADPAIGLLVHAGVAPDLSIAAAQQLAQEVEHQLQTSPEDLFKSMYGNSPIRLQDAQSDAERWRYAINSLTRMRYCFHDGSLELKEKGELSSNPALVPWFEFWRQQSHPPIFFGHWAALNGHSPVDRIHALDTGCVWGNRLTAYCTDTDQRYSVEGYKKLLY